MTGTAKLKVFTTAVGFHDALVAAPSRAAALRAWGSEHDLFARGMACEVTDPDIMAEPLSHPGEVIRRARDGDAPGRSGPKVTETRPPYNAKLPKPSRASVDEAERALAAAKERHRTEDADHKAKVEAAQRERRAAQAHATTEERELTRTAEEARDRYRAAVERWEDGIR